MALKLPVRKRERYLERGGFPMIPTMLRDSSLGELNKELTFLSVRVVRVRATAIIDRLANL